MSPNNDNNLDELDSADLGIAGKTARAFIKSPLSPLLYTAMFLMGLMGYLLVPRQEDPQISVPMIDLMVPYPGATADQVSRRAIEPLERIMSEIPGVKHVYSASQRGMGMVTIQFVVGEQMTPSLVKVNDKLDSNMDKIPSGVSPPLVKAVGIDDVPVVTLTLWSKDLDKDGRVDVDDSQLRMLAHDILQNLNEIENASKGFVVGGRKEVVKVEVLPEILAGYGISMDQVAGAIGSANLEQQAGSVETGGTYLSVVTGAFLSSAADVEELVVGSFNGSPIRVRDVAAVTQGPEDATQLVAFYTGPSFDSVVPDDEDVTITRVNGSPAVTIAIAKKEGSNGVTVAQNVIDRVESLKGKVIPSNVDIFVTRNYGQTAKDKVNELIGKLFKATGFVFVLVLLAFRAFKPAIVVSLVIPVVLLFTIFIAWIWGFTIDRVSLFALIFSIGILVDDAIVVVENIYRRWLEKGSTDLATAVDAVREVGNPTILATFTVIGALLPMGFVSGMMGPYMAPIPALGSVAMAISLFAAFVFTPWLASSRLFKPSMRYLEVAEQREHKEAQRLEGLYRGILTPMIRKPAKRKLFNATLWILMLAACSMFYFKWVAVKMLPLDNKPEFSVVLDMPEGTALPDTANMTSVMAEQLRKLPEVTAIQTYVGTARPFDFNGMVRHYYLRQSPWQAELQVQLLDKGDRDRSSHEIAVQARKDLYRLIEGTAAKISVVEMPPGPPVLQSVVAEVHGPDAHSRTKVAADLTEIFAQTDSLVDVDNYMRQPYSYWRFEADREKAALIGVTQETINRNLTMALGSMVLGDVKQRSGHEPINIVLQVPFAERSNVSRLGDLPVNTPDGNTVPIRELGYFHQMQEEEIIYHKDLRSVEYVIADVGGRLAAPVYGMLQVQDILNKTDYHAPDGARLANNITWMGPPENDNHSSFEWAGEWTVTYETFRDMGAAFMVALAFIYFLVVWEFGNFRIPALIMAPIPLTLLGIIPAHGLAGAEFTATSMIGWIALAGIIVRNSILLVDFTIHAVRDGVHLEEAVIRACMTRTRPILITALALVAGSSVILSDPIFQGMAISLAAGVLVSTILTLVVIPLGTCKARTALYEVAGVEMPSEDERCYDDKSDGDSDGGNGEPKKKLSDRLIPIWSAFITIVMVVVGVIVGIFNWIRLLVGALLPKRAAKETPPPTPPPSAAPPPPAPKPPPAPPAAPEPAVTAAPAAEAISLREPIVAETVQLEIAEPLEKTVAEPLPEVAEKPAVSLYDEPIIETSQASADDLDLLSAPIRPQPTRVADDADPVADALGDAHVRRKRRGIRLRDTSTDSDDGLN